MLRILLSFFVALSLSFNSQAQLVEVPNAVKLAFANQYPKAKDIEFKNLLASVQVHFTLNDEKMLAKYTNKGVWKETEKEWNYDHLSKEVHNGFEKSKYADWNIIETAVINRADGTEVYRIKVEKSSVQKKYLYFNKEGRLFKDDITL